MYKHYIGDKPYTQSGWVCPKCGRVYSPSIPFCFYCRNETFITTDKVTITNDNPEWWKIVGGSDYWDNLNQTYVNIPGIVSNKE